MPKWVGRLGVSKTDFLQEFSAICKDRGMEFSLVYVEAFHAATQEFLPEHLPANVEQLLFIRENSDYSNILYADVLRSTTAEIPFSIAMIQAATPKFSFTCRNLQT